MSPPAATTRAVKRKTPCKNATTTSASSSSSKVARSSSSSQQKHTACDNNGTDNGSGTASSSSPPVIVVNDDDDDNAGKKRILDPTSPHLLEDMLGPMTAATFFEKHFRRNAVHIRRRRKEGGKGGDDGGKELVSRIVKDYMFDLNSRRIFEETSSENVFLWLKPPPPVPSADDDDNDKKDQTNGTSTTTTPALNSVEIPDPATAHLLHQSGPHAAYCRASPELEQTLVSNLLRATGLGCGQYDPAGERRTCLGRGEVEVFLGVAPSSSASANHAKNNGGGEDGTKDKEAGHVTGWHTDFQENFTIQLSGTKRWTLRRGAVRHPLRATTPHYGGAIKVAENQLKMARMCHGEGGGGTYGFEYGDDNAVGEEMTVELHPGDVFYFPSGMWHRVVTSSPGGSASINVSLMGTTYAQLASEALHHLLLRDEGWREVVVHRPPSGGDDNGAVGGSDDAVRTLDGLMSGLARTVEQFVREGGGARSVLPPVLCHPPAFAALADDSDDEEELEGKDEKEEKIGTDEGEEEEECEEDDEEKDVEMDEEGENGSDGAASLHSERSENGNEESDDDGDDDDHNVSVEDFAGPDGWSCERPSGDAKLVKNPLASLMTMEDVTPRPRRQHEKDASGNSNDGGEFGQRRQYVLNVNFGGNEMYESHVRAVLESTAKGSRSGCSEWESMDWYAQCETNGTDAAVLFNQAEGEGEDEDEGGDSVRFRVPPDCLFYYGYFSWLTPTA